jgi:hypothetical protein
MNGSRGSGAATIAADAAGDSIGVASVLPGRPIFDNLFVRVSADVGRHSCE